MELIYTFIKLKKSYFPLNEGCEVSATKIGEHIILLPAICPKNLGLCGSGSGFRKGLIIISEKKVGAGSSLNI